MSKTKSKINPVYIFIVLLGVPLIANFLAFLGFNFIVNLVFTGNELKQMQTAFYKTASIVLPFSFSIPIIIIIIYILPITKIVHEGKHAEDFSLAQRRLLNSSLIVGMLGIIGWLIGLTAFLYNAYSIGLPFPVIFRHSINNILFGIFCFVLIYYSLEFINRRFFIPRFFPEGKLSGCRGAITPSITFRFIIFFVAVTLFPVVLSYNFIISFINRSQLDNLLLPITLMYIVVLMLSRYITQLISRSYKTPLVEMKHATDKIRDGDYDINVSVISNDEIGILGEGLNEMAEELKEKEFIKYTFGKVVDPRVRDYLLSGNIDLGGEIKEATILFSDIRGFTSMSEKMSPDRVVDLLNRHFEKMSNCIIEENGLINKYIGDAILAVFGTPVEQGNHPEAAVRAALKMREALSLLNEDLKGEGFPTIRVGIGIHTGEVLAGNIGSSSRMEYTVIGDSVNVASRIEHLCRKFERDMIFSESTFLRLSDLLKSKAMFLAKVRVRGKEQSIKLYYI